MASAATDPILAARPEPARAEPAAGKPAVRARWTLLAAAAGLGGAAALGASFGLLLSPPPLTAPLATLTRYAASHHHVMLAAAWLEGTGTLLQAIFVLALAQLAPARAALAGRITTVACAAVLGVSLVYDVMLIAIAQSAALSGPQTTTAVVAYGLFAAVEHVFLIALPLLLPLGLIPRSCSGPSPGSPSSSAPWGRSWAWPGCSPSPSTTTALRVRQSTRSSPPRACGSSPPRSRWHTDDPRSPALP